MRGASYNASKQGLPLGDTIRNDSGSSGGLVVFGQLMKLQSPRLEASLHFPFKSDATQ